MKSATSRSILLAGWLLFLLYAYPGYMSTAAVDQLVDSRVGSFTDWNSPVMTELWRIVGCVMSGPAGMLLLTSSLLLGGSYALLRHAMSERAAAVMAACALLFPPIATTMAVICPESAMAGFLIAGAAAVFSSRRAVRLLGLALLLLACGMRDGAALAALPIVVLGFVWRVGETGWRRYATAVAAWLSIAVMATGLTPLLTDVKTQRNQVALAALDIAGLLHFAKPMSDAELDIQLAGLALVDLHDIQRHAGIVYWHPEHIMDGESRLFNPPATGNDRDVFIATRNSLAREYPGAYLTHRWHQFMRVMGWIRTPQWSPVYTSFTDNADQRVAAQHAARHSSLQLALVAAARWLGNTWLFHPYLFFLLATALLPLAAIRRRRDVGIVLVSGLLYELSLLVVTADAQFRYSHWLVTCTVVAMMMMSARKPSLAWDSKLKPRAMRAAVQTADDGAP